MEPPVSEPRDTGTRPAATAAALPPEEPPGTQTTEALALDAAARIDGAIAEGRLAEMGPLAGVPVGYKDNLNLTDTHTTCASNMLRDYDASERRCH